MNNSTHEEMSVLWEGKPSSSRIFSIIDILLVPFSILWCVISFTWNLLIYRMLVNNYQQEYVFFAVVGAVFLIFGIYFLLGRFIREYNARKMTTYLITDSRVIIKNRHDTKTVNPRAYKSIEIIKRHKNNGTICIGDNIDMTVMYVGTGLDFFVRNKGMHFLKCIDNVDEVYQKIKSIR